MVSNAVCQLYLSKPGEFFFNKKEENMKERAETQKPFLSLERHRKCAINPRPGIAGDVRPTGKEHAREGALCAT